MYKPKKQDIIRRALDLHEDEMATLTARVFTNDPEKEAGLLHSYVRIFRAYYFVTAIYDQPC
jgi:hypothetical protein